MLLQNSHRGDPVTTTRAAAQRQDAAEVAAFYAFTRTAGGWKLFALSDIVIPA